LVIKKNLIYTLPLLVLLFTDDLFNFVASSAGTAPMDAADGGSSIPFTKIIPLTAMAFVMLAWTKYKRFNLIVFILVLAYSAYLVFESIYLYKSFFQFPHVFLKVFDLYIPLAFIVIYRNKLDQIDLRLVMHVIIIALFIKIALNPAAVSLSAFTSHQRLVFAPSVLLLILPALYFFNEYYYENRISSIFKVLLLIFFILYFQHRSVWVTAGAAFAVNIFLLGRQKVKGKMGRWINLVPIAFILLYVFSLILTYFPSVSDKVTENIENILNPTEDQTGSWRVLQMESYWPFVKEHLTEGLRLEGFELPVQFYHSELGTKIFKENTGHHFHSFYFDKLFYFGIIGLLLFFMFIMRPLAYLFGNKTIPNYGLISVISFSISLVVFGLAYNFPFYVWGIIGLVLAMSESEIEPEKPEEKGQEDDLPVYADTEMVVVE